ncbi:MAG: N-acetylmuramic acid 6-phosphate etherase [Amaricoccus sp.]
MAASTETRSELSSGLHALPAAEALARLLDGQRAAAGCVAAALPAIEAAAAVAAEAIAAGHRVAYAGAGSSGLMALADALELAGTFGIPPDRTPALIAGGAATLLALANAAEDGTAEAADAVAALAIGPGDALIGVSASGTTPYTRAAADAARLRGARVIGIANVAGSPLLVGADVAVLLDSGPELVAGSTRMGAATAQKIALNLISTLVGLRLGHVYDGYMVNLVADNAKLRGRAVAIVAAVSGAGEDAARAALAAPGGAVKPAILAAAGAGGEAAGLLAASRGHLGPALAALRAGARAGS